MLIGLSGLKTESFNLLDQLSLFPFYLMDRRKYLSSRPEIRQTGREQSISNTFGKDTKVCSQYLSGYFKYHVAFIKYLSSPKKHCLRVKSAKAMALSGIVSSNLLRIRQLLLYSLTSD